MLKAFLQTLSTHDRVQTLIRQGVGVHETTWSLSDDDRAGDSEPSSSRSSTGARIDVPHAPPDGIDHVALALACRDGSGNVLSSSSLGVIRPASFYGEEGRNRIAGFLQDVRFVGERAPTQVAGALLSLGDLAFELNLAHAA